MIRRYVVTIRRVVRGSCSDQKVLVEAYNAADALTRTRLKCSFESWYEGSGQYAPRGRALHPFPVDVAPVDRSPHDLGLDWLPGTRPEGT